jgi:hypothetical protein
MSSHFTRRTVTHSVVQSPSLTVIRIIAPDPRSHITTTGREEIPGRTRRDGDDGVFVALKHHLRDARVRVPELDAAIFGAAHDPIAEGG